MTSSGELDYVYHYTVKKVSDDYEHLQFNTAISQMMIFTNEVYRAKSIYVPYLEGFVKMLSCIVPHLGEELWSMLGHQDLIVYQPWPKYLESKLVKSEIEIALQVNGKLRNSVKVPADISEADMEKVALADEAVQRHTSGKTIKKVIVVKGKIVNIVAI